MCTMVCRSSSGHAEWGFFPLLGRGIFMQCTVISHSFFILTMSSTLKEKNRSNSVCAMLFPSLVSLHYDTAFSYMIAQYFFHRAPCSEWQLELVRYFSLCSSLNACFPRAGVCTSSALSCVPLQPPRRPPCICAWDALTVSSTRLGAVCKVFSSQKNSKWCHKSANMLHQRWYGIYVCKQKECSGE